MHTLQLTKYRAFENATIRLGGLTALVGPNASGKSSILRASVGQAIGHRDERNMGRGCEIVRRRSGASDLLTRPGHGVSVLGPLLTLLADEIRKERTVQQQNRLEGTGAQLVNVLASMPRRQREELAQRYVKLVPVFADVDVRPSQAGHHRIVFQDRWSPSVWYEPAEVSDGSLLALALLSIAYQLEPVSLVAIEEPEHGLHPHLVGQIVDLMRSLSERTPAPIQFVLATQSSDLLEHLRPEEVRFLTRTADGSVTVEEAPTDTPAWREAYQAHQSSMASLWLSGAVGGVP